LLDSHDIAGADRHLTVASSLLEPAWLAEPNEDLRLWLAWNRLLEGHIDRARGDDASANRAWTAAHALLGGGHDGQPLPFERLDPLLRTVTALGLASEAALLRQRLDAAGYKPLRPLPSDAPVAAR
ncbi:MAG: hypothetical protein ACR2J7_06730, partial [Luteimonas sp.]